MPFSLKKPIKNPVKFFIKSLVIALPFIGLISFAVTAEEQSAVAVPKLPIAAFAQLPVLDEVQLSPNGERIAALLNIGDRTVVVTRDVFGSEPKIILKNDNEKFVINWFHWLNNERLAVSVRFPSNRYGVATTETRLISIRSDGTSVVNLVDPNRIGVQWVSQFQDNVIDWLPDDPEHILIAADMEQAVTPTVYRVDVNTGSRSKLENYRQDVVRWITDQQHRVRVGIKFKEKDYSVIYCDPDSKKWKNAWAYTAFSDKAIEPMGFGLDPNILYVKAYHEGRKAVFTVDLSKPELTLVLKYANPNFDVQGALVHSSKTGEAIGVTSRDRNGHYVFWDEKYTQLALAIDKGLPDTHNFILGFDRDEKHYLLYSVSDTQPGIYYFGDLSSGDLSPIGETYPDLPPEAIAGKQIVKYKARDGVDIRGYLTLPKNVEAKNLPAIIFPHGGPIAHEDSDFDYWTTFFANRGYAVLQMDFRGSSGYGHSFLVAGLKQWGLHMQDDITDGTQWLIDNGIADKKRICIVGASYGGYAAMMGVAKTPDLFRCAVSFAGVSNLLDLSRDAQVYTNAKVAETQIGSFWSDRAQLKATSPQLLTDQITVPILLVHGTKDRSVPFSQSEDMAAALKKSRKPFQFIELEGGDHHLSRYEHRLRLFEEMERFLAVNLGTVNTDVTSNTQQR